MPVRLLIGLIRPVFLSKFATTGDFAQLVRLSNMLFRLNMVLFAFPIVLLIVAGEPVFDWLTAGKYGSAAILLAGFLCILILEGLKFLFNLLTQAVEKTEIMLIANLLASASLVLAFLLFPVIGVWAVIVAGIVGVIVAISLSSFILGRKGYPIHMDWKLCSFVVIGVVVAIMVGLGVLRVLDVTAMSYVIASATAMVTLLVLLGVVMRPFTTHEIATMRKLLVSGVKGGQNAAVVS